MRVHEAVIIVAMLFAGSNVAGSMARRDSALKVLQADPAPSTVARQNPAVAQHAERSVRVAVLEPRVCAAPANGVAPCDPARSPGTAETLPATPRRASSD